MIRLHKVVHDVRYHLQSERIALVIKLYFPPDLVLEYDVCFYLLFSDV